jgi:hypothetical protein
VWKVLRRVEGLGGKEALVSAWIDSEMRYNYSTNRENVPRIGKFLAFESLGDAVRFIPNVASYGLDWGSEIWECESGGVEAATRICFGTCNLSKESALTFWTNPNTYFNPSVPPAGTVFCSTLKLKKKVAEWSHAMRGVVILSEA